MRFGLSTIVILVLSCTAAISNARDEEALLLTERWHSARVVDPVKPDDEEIARVELLFARSLDREMTKVTIQAWKELGFDAESLRVDGDRCHLLSENRASRRGRGMFLLCPAHDRFSTLLIPHGFHDRFTAEIGTRFATEGRFRAIAWNTAPRDVPDEDAGGTIHDVAHAEESYFTALARAASVLGLPGPVVQLHGFAPYLRSTEAGRSARAILSSGTTIPHESTLFVSECLTEELGERLLVYPTQVNELGGTLNRVAAVLRDWGRKDFLHLEISFALRRRLLEDPVARRAMVECIEGASR